MMPPAIPQPVWPQEKIYNKRTPAQQAVINQAKAAKAKEEDKAVEKLHSHINEEVTYLAECFSKKEHYFYSLLHLRVKSERQSCQQVNSYNAFLHDYAEKENGNCPAGQKLSLREISDKIQKEKAYEKVTREALTMMEENLAAVKASKHIGKCLNCKSRRADIAHAIQHITDELYALEAWSLSRLKGVALNNRVHVQELKKSIRDQINEGLGAITGSNVRMVYTDQYDDWIVMNDLNLLDKALRTDSCGWVQLNNQEYNTWKAQLEKEAENGTCKALKWAGTVEKGHKRNRSSFSKCQRKRQHHDKEESDMEEEESDEDDEEEEEEEEESDQEDESDSDEDTEDGKENADGDDSKEDNCTKVLHDIDTASNTEPANNIEATSNMDGATNPDNVTNTEGMINTDGTTNR